MPNFIPLTLAHGLSIGCVDGDPLTSLSFWKNDGMCLPPDSNHFGFVYEGNTTLRWKNISMNLASGMFFSIPGEGFVGGNSSGMIVSKKNYSTIFTVGGPLENSGRLMYIDGCTDSLLIPPVLLGDPCFNALYFPPGIFQTQHTHPSVRVGMVVSGRGECVVPEGRIPLIPGDAFIIPTDGLHSFETEDSPLVVVAYHPDSDYGPTHENHPMINRTIVNGVSASLIDNIRTKELVFA